MHYKDKIAARAAAELESGQIVNLGIGLPTLILEHLPRDTDIFVHSENGILGMGRRCRMNEADPMLIDSGGSYIFSRTGASFFDSALSFSLIRSGRLDVAVLGTLEVAGNGDLANWIIPGKFAPGIGGGMELAQKANKLIVATSHTTRKGAPKIIEECTLPVTARGCVDMIITELAVMEIIEGRLHLRELAHETQLDDVLEKTGTEVIVPQGDIQVF